MRPGDRPQFTYRVYRSSRAQRRRRLRRRRLTALGLFLVMLCALGFGVKTALFSDKGASAKAETVTVAAAPAPAVVIDEPTPPHTEPSPSPAQPAGPVIEIGWVGDTTPGSSYGNPPDDGRAIFSGLRRQLSAPDLMIANLEGTYSEGGASKCDGVDSKYCYAFQAPPAYAAALRWAGIDLVSLANNHSYDYFAGGLQQTIRALDGVGVAYAGLPGKVTVKDVKGVRVAVVAFSPYSWNPNIANIPAARKLVARAADQADVVVVLMHVGAEGADKIHTPSGPEFAYGEARGAARAFAHAAVDAGADLVLGSGPHVIRGIERYKDRLIAYSLGNFAGWGNFGTAGNLGLSGLLTVRVDQQGQIRSGRWLSLTVADPGVPTIDPAQTAAALVSELSTADFADTYVLDTKGAFVVE